MRAKGLAVADHHVEHTTRQYTRQIKHLFFTAHHNQAHRGAARRATGSEYASQDHKVEDDATETRRRKANTNYAKGA